MRTVAVARRARRALAAMVLGTVLGSPGAQASPGAAVAPAYQLSIGCVAWGTAFRSACYLVFRGAYASVKPLDNSSLSYYAGTQNRNTTEGDAPFNFVSYRTSETDNGDWDAIEPGEVNFGVTGDPVLVTADVHGCAVDFELHRDDTAQDTYEPGAGAHVWPSRPSVSAGVSAFRLTSLPGSGALCDDGVFRVGTGLMVTVTGTSAAVGEDRELLQGLLDIVAGRLGMPSPPLPDQIPPP